MRVPIKYTIQNINTGSYLFAIGENEKAPPSGLWDKNLEKAKQYDQETGQKIVDALNKVYRHNMDLEAKLFPFVEL
ncbi:MAG: hypothetical protein AABW91_04020 [Nanoarchaeota archaeon]